MAPPAVVADTKPSSMFTSGKSAMLWAGDWQCAPIAEAFAGRLEEVDVAPLPQGEKRVTYPVSKNTSAWADHEGDYLTPAFAGQTTVTDAVSQLATFMNGELAKEG